MITLLAQVEATKKGTLRRVDLKPILFLRSLVGHFINQTWPVGNWKYGGHQAVTRSLVEGLERLNVPFKYNPQKISEIGETVVVLSGVEALRLALSLKNEGKIKKLIAGPNVVQYPDEHDSLLGSEGLDYYVLPSEMTARDFRSIAPSMQDKFKVWYAGVDERFWQPTTKEKENNQVLVYFKNSSEELLKQTQITLEKKGFKAIVIRYGRYSSIEFKNALEKSLFAVFLSKWESQGLALAESWSMDVPTLVWNEGFIVEYAGKQRDTTASPYLTEATGKSWKTIEEFEQLLIAREEWLKKVHPREWVLEHMTDEKSAQLLLEILKTI